MKTNFKKYGIIVTFLIVVLSMLAFAACSKTPSHDYKISVVGVDDKPYTGVQVYLCLMGDTGMCFDAKDVDENGVVYFDAGEGDIPEGADELAVHLQGLSDIYTYDSDLTIKKGGSLTIRLRNNLTEVEGGTGAGEYDGSSVKSEGFEPYRVGSGVYAFKFTENKPIFIEFTGDKWPEKFRARASGDVNAKITLLEGNKTSGISKPSDAASATGKDFKLEFTHTKAIVDGGDKSYFELTLNDATALNKEFYVVFEYVGEVDFAKYPTKGKGFGEYPTDVLTGSADTTKIKLDTFDPYRVEVGSYLFKFDKADQRIYYAFKGNMTAPKNYKVYSTGKVDAQILRINGSFASGLLLNGEKNDNISATDKNFSLDFYHDQTTFDTNDGVSWFEVKLSDPADVGKEGEIVFEVVSDYEPPEQVPETFIEPAGEIGQFPDYEGDWHDAPLDGEFEYALGVDGFYHANSVDGPIICVSLGSEDGKRPRGYDSGFYDMCMKHGQGLSASDGATYNYNYLHLVEAYTTNANSDVRYGLTKELKEFLERFVLEIAPNGKEWLASQGVTPPDGEEWLFACGYYDGDPTEALPLVPSIDMPSNKNAPIEVTASEEAISAIVPANDILIYEFFPLVTAKYTISFSDAGVEMKWLDQNPDAAGEAVSAQSGVTSYGFTGEGQTAYYFTLKNTTQEDIGVELNVMILNEESMTTVLTDENFVGVHEGQYDKELDFGVPFKFSPTQTATYKITVGANTYIVIDCIDENDVPRQLTSDDIADMGGVIEFRAGWRYDIRLSTVDNQNGTVSFIVETVQE